MKYWKILIFTFIFFLLSSCSYPWFFKFSGKIVGVKLQSLEIVARDAVNMRPSINEALQFSQDGSFQFNCVYNGSAIKEITFIINDTIRVKGQCRYEGWHYKKAKDVSGKLLVNHQKYPITISDSLPHISLVCNNIILNVKE